GNAPPRNSARCSANLEKAAGLRKRSSSMFVAVRTSTGMPSISAGSVTGPAPWETITTAAGSFVGQPFRSLYPGRIETTPGFFNSPARASMTAITCFSWSMGDPTVRETYPHSPLFCFRAAMGNHDLKGVHQFTDIIACCGGREKYVLAAILLTEPRGERAFATRARRATMS